MKACGFRPGVVTYTRFVEAYCREKDFCKVESTLEEMEKDVVRPGVVVYTIMMNAYAKAKKFTEAMEVYEKMKKNDCSPDASFYNILISALSRAGRLKDSGEVFEDMSKQGVSPDVSTYNRLILIAAKKLDEEKALSVLMEMEGKNNCKPLQVEENEGALTHVANLPGGQVGELPQQCGVLKSNHFGAPLTVTSTRY